MEKNLNATMQIGRSHPGSKALAKNNSNDKKPTPKKFRIKLNRLNLDELDEVSLNYLKKASNIWRISAAIAIPVTLITVLLYYCSPAFAEYFCSGFWKLYAVFTTIPLGILTFIIGAMGFRDLPDDIPHLAIVLSCLFGVALMCDVTALPVCLMRNNFDSYSIALIYLPQLYWVQITNPKLRHR